MKCTESSPSTSSVHPWSPWYFAVRGATSAAHHRGALRLHVHFPLEVVLPGEADERLDVLGEDFFRRTLGDPPDHEGAGAEVVRAHPGGVLPEAVVGDVVRRRRSAGAPGNECGRYRETQRKPESPCCLHRSILPLTDRFYGSRAGTLSRHQFPGRGGRH